MHSTLNISSIKSPIGNLTAGFTEKGLALLSFSSKNDLILPPSLSSFEINTIETKEHVALHEELHAYFNGELKLFKTSLDLHGTDFQLNVWRALLDVPYGTTRSYKQQAIKLGNVKAIRAVATANGANPIPIIVPCHRIVGSDQSLTGYAGGLKRKQFLLELESSQGNLFH